jgi:hypothetical protein
MSTTHELDNCRRTLEKAQEALAACEAYFRHQAEMNAQSHMSQRVMYPPIHSVVATTMHGCQEFFNCYPGEVEVLAGGPGS